MGDTAGRFFVESLFLEGGYVAQGDGLGVAVDIPKTLRALNSGEGVGPRMVVVIVEHARFKLDGSVAHAAEQRIGAHQFFDIGKYGAFLPSGGVEQRDSPSKRTDGAGVQVGGDDQAIGLEGHERVEFLHGAQHIRVGLQDVVGGGIGGHGHAEFGVEDHFVELAFDDAMDLAGIFPRQAIHAGIADPVFLREYERMHVRIEGVVAQKPFCVGFADGTFRIVEHLERLFEIGQKLRGAFVVHHVPQAMHFMVLGSHDQVEQGVGPLVAQKEGIAGIAPVCNELILGFQEIAAEKIVRHDRGHGHRLRKLGFTGKDVPIIYNGGVSANRMAGTNQSKHTRVSEWRLIGSICGRICMKRNGMNRTERSWVLYDVGNSAFVLLSTALIPVYFKTLAEPGSSVVVAWGYAETVASLILALLMPVLGSLADIQGNKKKFLVGTIGTGAVACAALGIPTEALPFLIVYVITAVMLNGSMVFYDAFLVDATEEKRYDEISSQGYAWGYIGSCVPFIACLAVVLAGPSVGIPLAVGMKIAFAITAVWWVVFSIPLIRNVHQVHGKPRGTHVVRTAFAGLGRTISSIVHDKRLLMFMGAFFFYIDGVHTIIKMSTSYGTDLGIDSTQLVLALLVTQFVAFPSAIAYGRLAGKFGTRRMLLVAVAAYGGITLFAAFFLRSAVEFWILAICVGLFQGGVQALSRSEFGKLIPKERANEYYGFFDIFGKYAAVMGTLLVSVFTQLTGNSSWGVLSIVVLFAIGFVLLWKMPAGVQEASK